MIWADAARSLLSLAPAGLAVGVFGVRPGPAMWPVAMVAVVGVTGAAGDALRWLKTRYRITDEHVERRTGLLVRQYRSIRRDRIRSVDTSARLRHRLAGLRLVTIGAGQQSAAGEAALALDAVSRETAQWLRQELLYDQPAAAATPSPERELARLHWSWVFYNVFNVWAYLAAAGVLWGAHWLATTFGLNLAGSMARLVDWRQLWSVGLGLLVVGAFGVVVLAVGFITEHWRFRLVRVPGEHGTVLRTTQGLLKTREVNRDDRRLRGLAISEPLLWRWLGVADTNVITTGLSTWSLNPASTILPRGPVRVARSVAAAVLAAHPLAAPLRRHPRAALRRRAGWAVLATATVTGVLAWLAATVDALPGWAPLAGPGLLPVALAAAVVAHRALGHALADGYLVVRSGVVSRTTAALQSRAVVGWCLRQSLPQRRLGLATVVAATAAGNGQYAAYDLPAAEAAGFADRAVPGLLAPFLDREQPR
jgi:putative membrane protein